MSGVEPAGDGGETQGPRLVAAAPCLEAQRCQESVDHLAHGTLGHASGGGDVTGGCAGEPQASPQASSPTADEMPQTQPPGSAAVGLECEAARAGEAESGAKAAEGKDGDSKRDYVRWAPEEEETFYLALRGVAGQKPEICLREITNRLTGSKDYAQVRHYYYRLIKRLNKILGEGCTLDIGNPLQVHQSMLKFWDVFAEMGMKGTCMTGIMKKPRKQRELSATLQRGVKAVMQRTGGAAAGGASVLSARGGSNSRKRKPRESNAAADGAAPVPVEQQGDEEMADAGVAPPPAKQQRRTSGPSTRRQQQLLAASEPSVEAAAGSGDGDVPAEGSSQSHTDGPEACAASDKPASSSHTTGSGPRDGAKKVSTSYSFRSSSNAGLSGPVLEGSQGQMDGRLRLQLQLMPLDLLTAQRMAGAGLHPFLELTLSDSKSLLSVLRHLATKWRQAAPSEVSSASGTGSGLLVHPPADCPMPLRGVCWGGPACDGQLKVSDIHSTLHCPTPFQLLYSWVHPGGAGEAPTQPQGNQAQQQVRPQQQQQQQQKPSAAQLAAHLRQAISEVAAGTPQPPTGSCAATAVANNWQQQQRQQQQQQQAVARSSQSFLQLLQCDDASNQAMQASPTFAYPSAAAASDELMAVANLAPVCSGGTPDQSRPAGSPPAGGECEVAATPSSADPRKPRGLMGLLQSPAVDKPGKLGRKGTPAVKKQPHSQRKPPRSGGAGVRRAGRSGRQQGQQVQQQQEQEQQQQQGGALPAGVGSFLWAHMHPHLQHPHPAEQQPPVSILQQQQQQQQQQHPVLQQAYCMPFMQQQQQCQPSVPAYHPPQPEQAAGRDCMQPGLDFGVSLHRMLGGAAAAADTPDLAAYRSPGSEQHQHQIGAAAPLPASGDFSLKSWPSLSPPSNFQLPEGFDSGISPVCKGGAMMPQLPTAAATLTGGAKAHPAAAAGALEALLGPTDFSMLLAGIGAAEGSTHQRPQAAGGDGGRAQLTAQAAAGPQQQTRLAVQPPEDSLFGGASLFGMLGTTHQGGAVPADGAALPLLPDKSLAELTFDFGSLMGVGDGTPSWGPPETHLAAQQQAPEGQAPAMGSRHFASLFDRQ